MIATDPQTPSADYHRVERAIRFVAEHAADQPELEDVARHLDLSPFHVQRLFTRWAGISPKRFLQFLTAERAKELLRDSETVLDATYETGLSSPSRLHDLLVTLEAATPGEWRAEGEGLEIRWGVHPSPFGDCFLAVTDRGVTGLAFVDEDGQDALDDVRRRWPRAELVEDREATARWMDRVFRRTVPSAEPEEAPEPLPVYVGGTRFQVQVWRALLAIPEGRAVSYGDVARAVGRPGAARAVGGAVGANPVAWLIPCHRVLRSTGHFGGYRWGSTRKAALLAWEAGNSERDPVSLPPETS